jgi:hypothetical protein
MFRATFFFGYVLETNRKIGVALSSAPSLALAIR